MTGENICVMCGQPGYSKSVEHDNDWLCFGHYQQFLDKKEMMESADKRAFRAMKEEAKKSAK